MRIIEREVSKRVVVINSIYASICLVELLSLDEIENTRFDEKLDIVVNNFDYYRCFDIDENRIVVIRSKTEKRDSNIDES